MTDTNDLDRRLGALATVLERPRAPRPAAEVRGRGEQRARRRRRRRAGGLVAGSAVLVAGFALLGPSDEQEVDTRAGSSTTTTAAPAEEAGLGDGSCGGYADELPEADAAQLRATFDPMPEGYALTSELARLETATAPGLCSSSPAALALGVPPDADGQLSGRGLVVRGPVANPVERSYGDSAGEYVPAPQATSIAGGQGEYRWIISPAEAAAIGEQPLAEAAWLEEDGSLWMAEAGGLDEAELAQALQVLRIDPPSQEVQLEGELPTGLQVLYERDRSWTWTPEQRYWMADLVQPGQVGANEGGAGFTLEVTDEASTPWSAADGPWQIVEVQGHQALLASFLQGAPMVRWWDGERTFSLSGPSGSEDVLLALADTVRLDPPSPSAGTTTTSAG
jgi:hypothetical protein